MMGGLMAEANAFPVSAFGHMLQEDFSEKSVLRFLSDVGGRVPIIGKVLGYYGEKAEAKESYMGTSMDVFRAGGTASRDNWRRISQDPNARQKWMLDLGLSQGDLTNMSMMSASYGQHHPGALMHMQAAYGMAQPGAELMGTMMRGGASRSPGGKQYEVSEYKVFADTLAVALTTNLDRGRWGEAFSAMSKAAQAITTGDIDNEALTRMQTFIGQMGPRFQGDTQAAAGMRGTLMGLQGGEGGGIAQVMALQAAGLGQPGVSFSEAWLKVQRGAAAGGVDLNMLIKRYMHLSVVQRYMAQPSEKNLALAVQVLSSLLPQHKPTDIEAILRTLQKSGLPTGPEGLLPGVTDAMEKHLKSGAGVPTQERRTLKGPILRSLFGADAAPNVNQEFGGDVTDTLGDAVGSTGLKPIESADDARMRGAGRTGPAVEMISSSDPSLNEGYGASRDHWPMGPGDVQEKGYKPGWRKSRPGDPKHMARDITVGNGRPGEKVYAPMPGTWLTNTPYLANRKEQKEGYIGEMLGDNGVRYKFMHLYFEPGLKKGKRIEAGELIGTVAEGTAGWVPHLHLEARRKIDGKTQVVDPRSSEGGIDAAMRDIMIGKTPVSRPSTPTSDPGFVEPDPKNPGEFRPVDPEKVVPVSMRGGGAGGMEVTINLSNEARRLLNISVHRKPATRRGVVG
jgi:hypothetical protein